ncbi:hypothetical protein H0H81_009626 [Sphagnurus paluster]|uniref:Uncharacterized protein n=1 Tax=Sphagnurus paluster TaxID=117069 RepID=A0A9P7K5L8_9AGAR|nr:hypothetical protein H0H81_009626 [Sphagnurus paluster]
MLLGLYQGLFDLPWVSPRDVHNWRLKGRLGTEIKAAFGQLPADNRGAYYTWFLQNQYILDKSIPIPVDEQLLNQVEETTLRAWRFTGHSESLSSQQIQEKISEMSPARSSCYYLVLALLIDPMSHPHPNMVCWFEFGFCTCRGRMQESILTYIYRALMRQCSFDELVDAFDSATLPQLMDSKGFGQLRRAITDLDDFMGSTSFRKSVWDLKQLVEVASGEGGGTFDLVIPSVRVDYGFMNCRSDSEFKDLIALYKQVFDMEHFSPIGLHEAAIQGKLLEHMEKFVQLKKSARKQFVRLLKNIYPLPSI